MDHRLKHLRAKTTKPLEENTEVNLSYLGWFPRNDTKCTRQSNKIRDKLDSPKFKTFVPSKDTIKKVKNSGNGESIYKSSDKDLASPIYKKCITRQQNNK